MRQPFPLAPVNLGAAVEHRQVRVSGFTGADVIARCDSIEHHWMGISGQNRCRALALAILAGEFAAVADEELGFDLVGGVDFSTAVVILLRERLKVACVDKVREPGFTSAIAAVLQ